MSAGPVETETRSGDLRRLARASSLNLAGTVLSAVANFVLPIIITRRLTGDDAGVFFSVTALFSILISVGTLGADTGVLWSLPRAKALGRNDEIRAVFRLAVLPVAVVSAGAALVVWLTAPFVAGVVAGDSGGAGHGDLVSCLRVLAVFLPVAAVYGVVTTTSRGLGSVKPLVVVEKIGRNFLQTLLVSVCVLATASVLLAVTAWVLSYVVAIVFMGAVVYRLIRAATAGEGSGASRPVGVLAREFWTFSSARALSRVFSVALQRVDILCVSAIRGLEEAAVYAAASRFLLLGLMFVQAIQQVMAPRISQFLASSETHRARTIYETTTAWLVLVSWPIYLVSAIFASWLLGVFGEQYERGAVAVTILCCAMLLATACGPVDTVLLMGGRSRWSMMNTGLALAINIALNLALVPSLGLAGAAIAWAAAIGVNNLLPLYQVRRFLGMHPFGVATVKAAVLTVVCFGVVGGTAALALGANAVGFAAVAVLGTGAYVAGLVWQRRDLDLDALLAVVVRRRR